MSIPALYGTIFHDKKEAAFSNFRLWQSLGKRLQKKTKYIHSLKILHFLKLGFAVAYSLSHVICTEAKLYMCLAVLLIGLAGLVQFI